MLAKWIPRGNQLLRTAGLIAIAIMVAVCCGCASATGSDPTDPYEKMNRKSFALNQAIDATIIRPPTVVYTHIVPTPLRTGIHHAFNNFGEITDVSNDLLQAKWAFAVNDTWRFIINSTLGLGGMIDVATKMHLPPHNEDFGLTLATWSGGKPSAYNVMPVLGPSTLRASFGLFFDFFALSGWEYIRPKPLYYTLVVLWLLDTRAQFLQADSLIQQTFDPYVFVRDAYMQLRLKEIAENRLSYREYVDQYYGHAHATTPTTTNDTHSVGKQESYVEIG